MCELFAISVTGCFLFLFLSPINNYSQICIFRLTWSKSVGLFWDTMRIIDRKTFDLSLFTSCIILPKSGCHVPQTYQYSIANVLQPMMDTTSQIGLLVVLCKQANRQKRAKDTYKHIVVSLPCGTMMYHVYVLFHQRLLTNDKKVHIQSYTYVRLQSITYNTYRPM